VLEGVLPVTAEDRRLLSPEELAAGWRLACRARADGPLKLELAQWEPAILSDDTRFVFTPGEGQGIAVDLGTTTIVAQLMDLRTGNVLGVRTALNAQARHGADIMSRVDFAVAFGQAQLQAIIREQIGCMVEELAADAGGRAGDLRDIVLVGNTVMHHLFCGISVEPLSHVPFEPAELGEQTFSAKDLGWKTAGTVRFLPCLGGFVGSDILAGIRSTAIHESDGLAALIDLGTNGEIVVGNRSGMLCASTAAGPAFEGARISMGMRAATGAISEVAWRDGSFQCRALGNAPPRGICGSGLVDAIAAALDAGLIAPTGKLAQGPSLPLAPPVAISQKDIRELQLAKGAIAAGVRILLQRWGAQPEDLSRVWLAGAFGNYISRRSARRIGLLNFDIEKIEPAGNTALRGAKLALFGNAEEGAAEAKIQALVQHISLNEDERFQEVFVDEMQFPS
jgi:uncharacterized 2Fe-2S/4Fe-4S cluster protein (DUF4445 family)